MRFRPSPAMMDKSVCEWNSKHHEVTAVHYWTGIREGEGKLGETWTAASVLGGHTAGVYIKGAGFVALSHVEAVAS